MRDRLLRDGFVILAVVFVALRLLAIKPWADSVDAYAYWTTRDGVFYDAATTGRIGSYLYSPAFAQALAPLVWLPVAAFTALWTALNSATLWFLLRRWALPSLLFLPIAFEVISGNVHLLYAAAIVLGFRWPATWALMFLTKVTPGVGVLWFLVRREWRSLVIAVGATVAIAAASYALDASQWASWVDILRADASGAGAGEFATVGWYLPIGLAPRLVAAVIVVVIAAWTDRRWLVPVAVVLAMPVVWLNSLAVLAACVPLAVPEVLQPAAGRSRSRTLHRATPGCRPRPRPTSWGNRMTDRTARAKRRELLATLPILLVVAAYIGFGLRTASNSLGCDFLAYFNAARHWLAGQPIYDLSVASTGTCGTYQYPPPFVLLAAPFSLFGFDVGNWLWIGFLVGCWAIGTAIMPLKLATRWTVLLLGAIGWPLIFGVRIGQVAPILYLVFAYAWRNLDRPWPLGASVAVGAMVKLQPGLLAVWLLSRRAWRALLAAAVVAAAIAGVAFVIGLGDWVGLATLLRALTDAVSVSSNLAIGATLHNFGIETSIAAAVQTINTIAILVVVVVAGLWLPRTPGFLVAVVASQLVSPIVWSHYALLLLLPVAWLLDRRQWWAALIPAIQVWILVPFIAPWTYTVAFYVTLVAVFAVGWRSRGEPDSTVATTARPTHIAPPSAPAAAEPTA